MDDDEREPSRLEVWFVDHSTAVGQYALAGSFMALLWAWSLPALLAWLLMAVAGFCVAVEVD